jgi:hypothetical protein
MTTSLTAVSWIRFQIQEGRKWLNKKMGKEEALNFTYYSIKSWMFFFWRAGGFFTVLEHGRPSWVPRKMHFFFAIIFYLFFKKL